MFLRKNTFSFYALLFAGAFLFQKTRHSSAQIDFLKTIVTGLPIIQRSPRKEEVVIAALSLMLMLGGYFLYNKNKQLQENQAHTDLLKQKLLEIDAFIGINESQNMTVHQLINSQINRSKKIQALKRDDLVDRNKFLEKKSNELFSQNLELSRYYRHEQMESRALKKQLVETDQLLGIETNRGMTADELKGYQLNRIGKIRKMDWLSEKGGTQKIVVQYGSSDNLIKETTLYLGAEERKNISVWALAQAYDPDKKKEGSALYKGRLSDQPFSKKQQMQQTFDYCRSNQSLEAFIDQNKKNIKLEGPIYLFFFQVKKPEETNFSFDLEIKPIHQNEKIQKKRQNTPPFMWISQEVLNKDILSEWNHNLSERNFYKLNKVYIQKSTENKQLIKQPFPFNPPMAYTFIQALVDTGLLEKGKKEQRFKLVIIEKN